MGKIVTADWFFYNGLVLTMDEKRERAECVLVKDNKILYVGDRTEAENYLGESTKRVDLRGRTLLPGFIDSHLHLGDSVAGDITFEFGKEEIHSIEKMKEVIRRIEGSCTPGTRIVGMGMYEHLLEEKRLPDRFDLDEASEKCPVVIVRGCWHMACTNSRGLDMMGIDDRTPDRADGYIERSEGKATGRLYENCFDIKAIVPSAENICKSLEELNGMLVENGITSIHDAGGYGETSMEGFRLAKERGVFLPRVYALIFSTFDNTEYAREHIARGPEKEKNCNFRKGSLKIGLIDGSSSQATAAVSEEYLTGGKGSLLMQQEEIEELVIAGHKKGFQVTAHVLGDRALEIMLDAFEKAYREMPRSDCRHRIEHGFISRPDLVERMKKMEISPVCNPVFFYEMGEIYQKHYTKNQLNHMAALGDYTKGGLICALGTDWSVCDINPLLGIYASVTRKTAQGDTIGEEQAVSLMDALKMYTINGAYLSFEEDIKGSIEEGKLADLTILSENILEAETEELPRIKVDFTMINGQMAYRRK